MVATQTGNRMAGNFAKDLTAELGREITLEDIKRVAPDATINGTKSPLRPAAQQQIEAALRAEMPVADDLAEPSQASPNGNGTSVPPSDNAMDEDEMARDAKLLAEAARLLSPSLPPEGWMADEKLTSKEGSTTLSYVAHNGTRVTVKATDFVKMMRGLEDWKIASVSDTDVEAAVDQLVQLSFLKCGICNQPLGHERRLLNACYTVVKNKKLRLPANRKEAIGSRGSKTVISFPGAHFKCMCVEEALTDIIVAGGALSDEELFERLSIAAEQILAKVVQEDDAEVSLLDIIDSITAVYMAMTRGGDKS